MSLPTLIKVSNKIKNEKEFEQELDVYVSDESLYYKNSSRFSKINNNLARVALDSDDTAKRIVFAFMNTLFIESANISFTSYSLTLKKINSLLVQRGVSFVLCRDPSQVISGYIADVLLTMIVRGVYCTDALPNDSFFEKLQDTFSLPTVDKFQGIKESLLKLYNRNIATYAKQNITYLVKRSLKQDTDISASIREYFTQTTSGTMNEMMAAVKGSSIL